MDALTLARIQFGISIGFHYLFPLTTLGMSLFIVIFEGIAFVKKADRFRVISSFLIRIFALIFTMGVATGIMMPFAVGGNWSRFAEFSGSIFGTAIAIEAIVAFAFESAFIAIVVFGRKKVSPFLYFACVVAVFAGAHFSALLIVAVNSWMQTPAGFSLVNDKIVLVNFMAAIFNPSTVIRYVHVVTGAWLTGAFVIAGIGGYFYSRGRHPGEARLLLSIALPLALALAVLQPMLGHEHIMNVLRNNPEKDAAYEGIFKTTRGAPLYMFGIPDAQNNTVRFAFGAPRALSFLESGDFHSTVRGLEEFPRENWPPVNAIFTTFHLMVLLGVIMIIASAAGVFLLYRKIAGAFVWERFLIFLVPVPYLANELGWIGTEVGRQPWVIYKVLHTAKASSMLIPSWQIATTLCGICLLYACLLTLTVVFVRRTIKDGFDKE